MEVGVRGEANCNGRTMRFPAVVLFKFRLLTARYNELKDPQRWGKGCECCLEFFWPIKKPVRTDLPIVFS